ncbi:MAG TPA: hypothetical protein VK442_10085 [Xanthobacteraceae bacterium]|nr:hypothetical protein [Xanthobacteraceae bacterium]
MTLVIFQTVWQSILSTLHWLGFSFGTRALHGSDARRRAWIFGSAVVAIAWLLSVLLLASNNFFRNDVVPPRIPLALGLTLMFGYMLLLSKDFRTIIGAIPQHWLIGVQVFRALGGVFLIRWWQGDLAAVFAIPAGVGDVLTGIFAPVVAYWWFSAKPYARRAAIAWNLFGMADLVMAVAIGASIQGSGMAFPIVMIPIYGVPRAFLIHSYSMIGLLRGPSRSSLARAAA